MHTASAARAVAAGANIARKRGSFEWGQIFFAAWAETEGKDFAGRGKTEQE